MPTTSASTMSTITVTGTFMPKKTLSVARSKAPLLASSPSAIPPSSRISIRFQIIEWTNRDMVIGHIRGPGLGAMP